VHAHFAAGAALDGLRLAALSGVTCTLTAHAFDIFRDPRNLREKLESADAVFTGCDYNVEHLRLLAPAAHVHKVVMGVDAEAFARLGPQPPVVVKRRWRWSCSSSPATRSGCPSACAHPGASWRHPAT